MAALRLLLIVLLLAGCAAGPPAPPATAMAPELARVLARGVPLDEGYRALFDQCDREDRFGGVRLPVLGREGQTHEGCRNDPNRVRFLLRLPEGAIAFESKLAVDVNGGLLSCTRPRPGDLCATALQPGRQPLDADTVPWVVIPYNGPPADPARPGVNLSTEFMQRTGLRLGDVGVVVLGTRVVPVIVGNGGPFNKLGEGSLALHRALGHEQCGALTAAGRCGRLAPWFGSLPGGAVTILFPGSAPPGLAPGNVAALTAQRVAPLWNALLAPR